MVPVQRCFSHLCVCICPVYLVLRGIPGTAYHLVTLQNIQQGCQRVTGETLLAVLVERVNTFAAHMVYETMVLSLCVGHEPFVSQ